LDRSKTRQQLVHAHELEFKRLSDFCPERHRGQRYYSADRSTDPNTAIGDSRGHPPAAANILTITNPGSTVQLTAGFSLNVTTLSIGNGGTFHLSGALTVSNPVEIGAGGTFQASSSGTKNTIDFHDNGTFLLVLLQFPGEIHGPDEAGITWIHARNSAALEEVTVFCVGQLCARTWRQAAQRKIKACDFLHSCGKNAAA
jgi:hypothetical protein